MLGRLIRRLGLSGPPAIPGPDAWLRHRPWIDLPGADIDAYVAALPTAPAYDLAAKLKQWRAEGVVIFRNAVPAAEIDAVVGDLEHAIAHPKAANLSLEINGQPIDSTALDVFPANLPSLKINSLHSHSLAAARLSLTAQAVDFLGHVFGAPVAVLQSLGFLRGSEQPVHCDYSYVAYQKRLAFMAASWIPLEDIAADSGPLGYYPGGHRPEEVGFFDWGGGSIAPRVTPPSTRQDHHDYSADLMARMREHGVERRTFLARKGDVLIWHAALPHEGTPVSNTASTRRSYVTHYTTVADLPERLIPPRARRVAATVEANGAVCYRAPWLLDRGVLPSWKS